MSITKLDHYTASPEIMHNQFEIKTPFIAILICIGLIGCKPPKQLDELPYFSNQSDCIKSVFRQTEKFESLTANDFRLPMDSYAEQGSRVINFIDLLQQAEQQAKPVMLYFTGFTCANCMYMEEQVLNDSVISKRLSEEILFVPLTVDERTKLPEEQQLLIGQNCLFNFKQKIDRIGYTNNFFQLELTQSGGQPEFYLFDMDGTEEVSGYARTPQEFEARLTAFLETR